MNNLYLSAVGHIDGCADKPNKIEIPTAAFEYAPTAGIKELRTAVANLYNEIYRSDKQSKYTYENVSRGSFLIKVFELFV